MKEDTKKELLVYLGIIIFAIIGIFLIRIFSYTSFEIICQEEDRDYVCEVFEPTSWDLDLDINAVQHCSKESYNSMRECVNFIINHANCKDIEFYNFNYYEMGSDEGTSVVPTPSVEAKCKPLNNNQKR